MNVRWSVAMRDALYGPGGFYTRQRPAGHFRTSAMTPRFGTAVARFLRDVDARLGHPDPFTVVDVGAGAGELLSVVSTVDDLDGRLRPVAVELRPRPDHLDTRIDWRATTPDGVVGAILACELLDNVPCDVAVADPDGTVRYQLVDPATGDTRTGEPVETADADWLHRWWPLDRPGQLAEIGRTRDRFWRDLTGRLARGAAVAIDYGHTRDRRPDAGSLTGYQRGRQVPAVPDGTRDITAHVAVDSLGDGRLCTQREALRELGIDGARPDLALAHHDPGEYLRRLAAASTAGALTDPAGLGGHYWHTFWRLPR